MVREATDSDIQALMPLFRGYCDFYKAKPSDEGLERMARAVIDSPQEDAFLLVSEDEHSREIVGFAACGWKWSSLRGARIVVIEDLFVAEHARGRGRADG
jgi:L-amino acid N-acyltransferase YncA